MARAPERRKRGRRGGRSRGGADFGSSGIRRAIVLLVTIKVAALVLLFDPQGLQAFDLPKSVLSRATGWLLLAAVVLAFLRFGWAIVPRSAVHAFVLAFAVVSALSATFAENTAIAFHGERGRYLGLTFVLDMTTLYFAVALAFRTFADWATLAAGGAAAGAVAIAYAGAQRLGLDPIAWGTDPRDRPFGTLGNADTFAHLLGVLFAAAVGIAAFVPGTEARRIRTLAIGFGAAVVALAAVVATRGFALGAAGALLALGAVYLRARGVTRPTLGRLAIGSAVVLGASLVLFVVTPLGERLGSAFAPAATQDRLLIYETATRAFLERPVLGYGPNSFSVAYPRYRQPGSARLQGPESMQSDAHNWVFETAATSGALGLITLIALLVVASTALWRAMPHAPVVAGCCLVVSAAYWTQALVSVGAIGVAWAPWVAFGGSAALAAGGAEVRVRRRVHPLATWSLLTAAVGLGLSGLLALAANRSAWEASVAWRGRSSDAALLAAASAVRLDGGRADHWNWLGLAHDIRGEFRQAGDAFAAAAERSPHRATYWMNLARTRFRQAQIGRTPQAQAEAVAAAERGVASDPNSPVTHGTLGDIALAIGDPERAFAEGMRAIHLYQPDSRFDDVAIQAIRSISDRTAARRLLENALVSVEGARLRALAAHLALEVGDAAGMAQHVRIVRERHPADATALVEELRRVPLVRGTYEEDEPRIAFAGAWTSEPSSGSAGGQHALASVRGSEMVIRFQGSKITLIGPRGPDGGRAEVLIDGEVVTQLDAYAEFTGAGPIGAFTVPPGVHHFRIVVTEERDPRAVSARIGIDKIVID